jgi:hypothetical protein
MSDHSNSDRDYTLGTLAELEHVTTELGRVVFNMTRAWKPHLRLVDLNRPEPDYLELGNLYLAERAKEAARKANQLPEPEPIKDDTGVTGVAWVKPPGSAPNPTFERIGYVQRNIKASEIYEKPTP